MRRLELRLIRAAALSFVLLSYVYSFLQPWYQAGAVVRTDRRSRLPTNFQWSVQQPRMKSGAVDDSTSLIHHVQLLPKPPPLTISTFVENSKIPETLESTERHRVLQCFLGCLAEDNQRGIKYGLGTPIDMPVVLGYFDDKKFYQVYPNDTIYDDLVQYVSHQISMDDNVFLLDTPISLTLQGEFEEDELNKNVFSRSKPQVSVDSEEGHCPESWEELIAAVDSEIASDPFFYNDQSDEDHDYGATNDLVSGDIEQDAEEKGEYPDVDVAGGALDEEDYDEYENNDEVEVEDDTPPQQVDEEFLLSCGVPREAIVTEEDGESFQRAHKRADRIFSYVDDMKLLGSFHYAKRHFHLIQILEVRILYFRIFKYTPFLMWTIGSRLWLLGN